MKKALLITSLLAAVMLVGVTQATAQKQITVTVTVPSVLSVELDTDAWPIGELALGDTATSTSITATNNGNVAETFTIESGGSTNWACGTVGSETFAMEAQGGDLTSYTSICSETTLETPVAIGAGVSFTLQFTAPTATAYVDTEQTITVTVTAAATT